MKRDPITYCSYNYVAGGDGEGKGLVETVKEKATEAYVDGVYDKIIFNQEIFLYLVTTLLLRKFRKQHTLLLAKLTKKLPKIPTNQLVHVPKPLLMLLKTKSARKQAKLKLKLINKIYKTINNQCSMNKQNHLFTITF